MCVCVLVSAGHGFSMLGPFQHEHPIRAPLPVQSECAQLDEACSPFLIRFPSNSWYEQPLSLSLSTCLTH